MLQCLTPLKTGADRGREKKCHMLPLFFGWTVTCGMTRWWNSRCKLGSSQLNDTLIVHNCGRWRGQIQRTRPSRSIAAGNLKIYTKYIHLGGATTLTFNVNGAIAVVSYIMRSPVPWNVVVPPDDTTLAYKFLQMSASHFVLYWKESSWNPLASLSVKLGRNNFSTQWKRSAPKRMKFLSGSSEVFFSSNSAIILSSVS